MGNNTETTRTELRIKRDNIEFIIETEFGIQPLDEILADYAADKIKEGDALENAA